MKAIVNLGLRKIELIYKIKAKDLILPESRGDNWETFQKNLKSKTIQCKQIVFFKDSDEWTSIQLLDGMIIDLHFDYEYRKEFSTKQEWLSYIAQAYEFKNEPQLYDNQLIGHVTLEL